MHGAIDVLRTVHAHGVYPHHISVLVQHGAAGIALVDGCVCLHKLHVLRGRAHHAACLDCADDAVCHRHFIHTCRLLPGQYVRPAGKAQRPHRKARVKAAGAQRKARHLQGRRGFQHSQVCPGGRGLHCGRHGRVVRKVYFKFAAALYHMVICHHIARVARHGEARAVEGVFAAYGHNAHRALPRVQHGARHALRAEGRARQQARQRQNGRQFLSNTPHKKVPIPREMPRRHPQQGQAFLLPANTLPLLFYHTTSPGPAAQASYTKKRPCLQHFAKRRGGFLFFAVRRGPRRRKAILRHAKRC